MKQKAWSLPGLWLDLNTEFKDIKMIYSLDILGNSTEVIGNIESQALGKISLYFNY